MNPRTLIMLVMALAFGLGAAVLVIIAMNPKSQLPQQTEKVVVAKVNIPGQVLIQRTMLDYKEVPKDFTYPGSFSKIDDVVGAAAAQKKMMTRHDIAAGDVVTTNKIAEGMGLLSLVEPGERALSIPVADPKVSVGGWITPGDFVDVNLTLDFSEQTEQGQATGGASTQTLLRKVKILAVGDSLTSAATGSTDNAGKKQEVKLRHVTMAVKPDDANLLILAAEKGVLSLVLRRKDEVDEKTAPKTATLAALFGKEASTYDDVRGTDQNELAKLRDEFDRKLNEQIDSLKSQMQPQGVANVPGAGPSPIAQPKFVRIVTFRGRNRGDLMISMPELKKASVPLSTP